MSLPSYGDYKNSLLPFTREIADARVLHWMSVSAYAVLILLFTALMIYDQLNSRSAGLFLTVGYFAFISFMIYEMIGTLGGLTGYLKLYKKYAYRVDDINLINSLPGIKHFIRRPDYSYVIFSNDKSAVRYKSLSS